LSSIGTPIDVRVKNDNFSLFAGKPSLLALYKEMNIWSWATGRSGGSFEGRRSGHSVRILTNPLVNAWAHHVVFPWHNEASIIGNLNNLGGDKTAGGDSDAQKLKQYIDALGELDMCKLTDNVTYNLKVSNSSYYLPSHWNAKEDNGY